MERRFGPGSAAGVARATMSSALAILLAMALGCGEISSWSRGTASPPPPSAARVHADFWSAISAKDFGGAVPLAASPEQKDYLNALVDVAEERLGDAQTKLLALQRSDDPVVAAAARQLLWLVLHERPSSASAPREWRARMCAPQSSQESWTLPPQPVTQPLLRRSYVLLVAVNVNGRATTFGVDTGAPMTLLSSRFAAEAGVVPSGVECNLRDTHGAGIPARPAVADVDLGGLLIERHRVAVIDASMLEFSLGPVTSVEFDGLLGWNAIRGFRLTLDNERRVLRLEASRRGAVWRSEFFWVGKPFVRARTANGFPLALHLDTGTWASTIAAELTGPAGLRGGREEPTLVRGVAGSRRVPMTKYAGVILDVGGARLRLPELFADPRQQIAALRRDGILGSDALTHGRVVIDFPAGEFSISGVR